MKTTRRRAHALRTTTVPVFGAEGQPAPLSNGEKARKVLFLLLKSIPTRQHVLIPQNEAEAHRQPDSLCVRLGLSFAVLGPLLFAAAILVQNKRGGLSVSLEGLQLLKNSYSWKDHHQVNFEEKKPSEKALESDIRKADDPPTARIKFHYIYRGQIVPHYSCKPLVANNLVIEGSNVDKVKPLSDSIVEEIDSSVAAIFDNRKNISVNTTRDAGDAGDADGPNLITPTEMQLQLPQPTSRVVARTLRTPPVRTPGLSPPLRRVRFASTDKSSSSRAFRFEIQEEEEAKEVKVETVQDEENQEEEERKEEEAPPVPPTPIEKEIAKSLALDFELRDYNGLRPAQNPAARPIEVNDRKQATGAMRAKIVYMADRLGYHTTRSKKGKQEICEAASRVVFYDCGCPSAPKGTMVGSWFVELDQARRNFETDFGQALENERLGPRKGTYVERIEAAHPNYLHELYWKAGKNPRVTFRATFAELADEMNRLSVLDANRPQLYLTREIVKRWFRWCGGKVRKGWERPILTPERMASRVQWCKERKAEMKEAKEAGKKKYYCFLDEKWFYIRSLRKKLKVLPRGELEAEGADSLPMETVSSRRHATKVMVLGVIADPEEDHDFDGKIYFARVARNQKYAKATYSDKILDDLAANTALQ